jgi:hypothetical protein
MVPTAVARYKRRMIKHLLPALALASLALAGPAVAQSRPDTDFCAKMRAKDPGGMCTAKGDYVTADKVYKPDGTVVARSTGG